MATAIFDRLIIAYSRDAVHSHDVHGTTRLLLRLCRGVANFGFDSGFTLLRALCRAGEPVQPRVDRGGSVRLAARKFASAARTFYWRWPRKRQSIWCQSNTRCSAYLCLADAGIDVHCHQQPGGGSVHRSAAVRGERTFICRHQLASRPYIGVNHTEDYCLSADKVGFEMMP